MPFWVFLLALLNNVRERGRKRGEDGEGMGEVEERREREEEGGVR